MPQHSQAGRDAFVLRPSRRSLLVGGGAVGLTGLLSACGVGGGGATGGVGDGKGEIRALFMKQAGYSEDNIGDMLASFRKANPEIKVTADFVSYEALHDKIVAAAPAGTYDVVLIDVVWPAEFGSKKVVADVTARWPDSWEQDMLAGAVATAQYGDTFYGVPWILDSKYFYYNSAHLEQVGLEPPQLDSWDGVLTAAQALKSAGVTKYPLVWSWQQAEALICDYAQLLGAFGGSFLDADGQPAFNQSGGVQALEFMRQTIVDGLTNPASTQSLEEDVRRVFSSGQASFALNWTYMFGLADDPAQSQVAGKVGILQTPSGPVGRPGVNGSMAMGVAAGSKNQDAAWTLIQHLSSQPVQDQFAVSSLPVWGSSFADPKVVKTNPKVVAVAKNQLADMILRPQVENYNPISLALQAELQKALLGDKDPQRALDDAASQAATLLTP
jgi:multiple sugar transport system substrate-binding protein